ncbi:2-C-methyl-D-erythritol 4-phosphate cytidylyltransferase [Luteibacter rhizovicinus DSM 16549]|uniref:2-C-methyl-D-erythritol 4-phosphate cytidylyltransferase n=1 Tax=Luteibacter rhizovicinus DSM 16549 TaxID=1440763 RepID=A0A0G9HHZ4_9GAMM|nr:2-C-methyl-D-erythritol 4-phosphate cytidylyltransferase [Luteibacter rhizovicinus]APG02475.1 2-C-methyl-D-erythritol 4-phosphate cytidylyltransferase [Luteibacter rhizovicinus DSM 16549]KLD67272.1 2-C-methyl-D-erythritol 4-phosphate cytidylyltransferase [Luteibacter rhizovicinus DSM 16549]
MDALWCVVPAAGRGVRAGGDRPKQYQSLAGRPLLDHTLERLAAHPRIAGLVVVIAADDPHFSAVESIGGKPLIATIGGGERSDSVLAGVLALPAAVAPDHFVLVHDAARPCVRADDITRLIDLAGVGEGGLLGAPLRDTLKRADADCHSTATEPREGRWRAFTPQMFRRGALARALALAAADGIVVSDEAMAMERTGVMPLLVEGSEDNIKVTTPADFALAEFLLGRTR